MHWHFNSDKTLEVFPYFGKVVFVFKNVYVCILSPALQSNNLLTKPLYCYFCNETEALRNMYNIRCYRLQTLFCI